MNAVTPLGAYRALHPGMGQAVAERTVLRKLPVQRHITIPIDVVKQADAGKLDEIVRETAQEMGFEPARGADGSIQVTYYGAKDEPTVAVVDTTEKRFETWGDVAQRVALGNASLIPRELNTHKTFGFIREYTALRAAISKAALLLSGRHLQHGDKDQPSRNMEVFTNCSTSPVRFGLFQLLLNGSGVGTSYDDDLCITDWNNAPNLRVVISAAHPDFEWGVDEDVRDARHKYVGGNVIWHEVADTREGWAKAIEIWERMAFERIWKDHTLVLDFSKVRPRGAPIMGMQGRPSSGPKPLMAALMKCASVKGSGMKPWMQAMYLDHYLAECVLVGGARRSARMATKWWGDEDVLDFIRIKRPIEYADLSMEEVVALRQSRVDAGLPPLNSFLWSSNNSVMVDREFWELVRHASDMVAAGKGLSSMSRKIRHAWKVWTTLTECAYADGTGEPGIINADMLVQKDDGWEEMVKKPFVGSAKYQVEEETEFYLSRLAKVALAKPWHMITNPCGEISLTVLGGYCVIADMVPFFADSLDEALGIARVTTRALMRVNLMDSLYDPEVKRTNRIGVGLTGVHEFAWKFFNVSFRQLLDPDFTARYTYPVYEGQDRALASIEQGRRESNPRIRAAAFWRFLALMSNTVVETATEYATELGVVVPHTMLTIKPAGTTSKLFGLTEGWHLPSMLEYLRWVQFRYDDPLVAEYRAKGYPTRELKSYHGTVIVGFPTKPTICDIGIPDHLMVTAGEATPEEQYEWLRLGEAFWINGQSDYEDPSTGHGFGNQISYTLKYKPDLVSYEEFAAMLLRHQPTVRCCSVMPQVDNAAFEYVPEQSITKVEFEEIANAISEMLAEDIGREHLDCATGACPVDIKDEK